VGLRHAGEPPSRRIARLARLVHLLDARRNELFAPLSTLLLWATQIGFAIEAWRSANGSLLTEWIAGVGDCESPGAIRSWMFYDGLGRLSQVSVGGPRSHVLNYTNDINGQVIGFPAIIDNLSVIYNKDLFDAAGVDYPAADWTWEDFRETAKALTDPSKGVFGVNMGHLWDEHDMMTTTLSELASMWGRHEIAPMIDSTFPFSRASDDHLQLAEAKNFGKVVLVPD